MEIVEEGVDVESELDVESDPCRWGGEEIPETGYFNGPVEHRSNDD